MKIENGKTFRLLKQLSKREKVQLRLFLESPFFNKRADVLLLFEQLIVARTTAIVPEDLFASIYPARKFKAVDLRLLLSKLFGLVEHFLIYQQLFQADKRTNNKRAAIHAYRGLRLPRLAQQSLRDYQKLLKEEPLRDANYYFQAFRLHTETYEFSCTERPWDKQPFLPMTQALDTAYFSLKLKQACHAISNQLTYGHQYELKGINEIVAYVQTNELQHIPAIGLYYYIYRTFTLTDSQREFQELKELLHKANTHFSHEELREIFLMLINHRIRAINRGEPQAVQQALELYKEGLHSKSLLTNGVLSRFTYINIVKNALKANELEWAEQFIKEYKNVLEKNFQTSTFNLNMALLAYTRKQYGQALRHLQNFDYRNAILALSAKTLQLKIYFEQGDWAILDSHLQAMSNYIRRQKERGYHYPHFTNIISYTKRIQALAAFDKVAKTQLENAILEEKELAEKEWLLECLEMLTS